MRPHRGAFLVSLLLAGCWHGEVVRVVDGVEQRGRFISDYAYAAYARGAEYEARTRYREALAAYVEAAAYDPASAELWTRIGSMLCRLELPAEAFEALDEAEEQDARYEPLWRERALCHERRGDRPRALEAARKAVALDPERDDTVILYAKLLASEGRASDALRWLRALALRSPASLEVWEAIATVAEQAGDSVWRDHARQRSEVLRERFGHMPSDRDAASDWRDVDEAIAARDLPLARKRLREARIDPSWLAPRAIALGRPELALEEAGLRVAADPHDSDARAALALAADLLGKGERAAEVLVAAPGDAAPLGAIGELLLAELVLRQAGSDSVGDWAHEGGGRDRMESDLLDKLRARLGGRAQLTEARP